MFVWLTVPLPHPFKVDLICVAFKVDLINVSFKVDLISISFKVHLIYICLKVDLINVTFKVDLTCITFKVDLIRISFKVDLIYITFQGRPHQSLFQGRLHWHLFQGRPGWSLSFLLLISPTNSDVVSQDPQHLRLLCNCLWRTRPPKKITRYSGEALFAYNKLLGCKVLKGNLLSTVNLDNKRLSYTWKCLQTFAVFLTHLLLRACNVQRVNNTKWLLCCGFMW